MAILHNLDRIEEEAGPEERLAHPARQGLLTLPKTERISAFPPMEKAEAKGELVSETIVMERR